MPTKISKSKSKELNIEREKAALRQRIEDIACGAGVDIDGLEESDLLLCFDCSTFGRFLKALKNTFHHQEKFDDGSEIDNRHLFEEYSFEHYDTIDNITNHLYKGGVRA